MDDHSTEWETIKESALQRVSRIEFPDDLQVPLLPSALNEFLQVSSDPNFEFRVLGRIIENDPGLTIDLLKHANSAAFGADVPVKTPADALVRLGISRARTYLIASGVRGASLAANSRLMHLQSFWNESLRRGLFARTAARKLGMDPEIAFICGLLQDFMLPVLTNRFDEDYMDYLRHTDSVPGSLADWEQEKFGWNHADAAAYVAQQWNMPDDLICGLLLHHQLQMSLCENTEQFLQFFPVCLAAYLPDQLFQVPRGIDQLITADARTSLLCLDEICNSVDQELAKIALNGEMPKRLSPIIASARKQMQLES